MMMPAGTENKVISKLTCSDVIPSDSRIDGKAGMIMEFPNTIKSGTELKTAMSRHEW